MKTIVLTLVAGWAVVTTGATAWRDDLWLGRGSFWTARVAVTVENPTGAAWEGKTVAVPLAQLPLKGVRVEELRLVDGSGVQLEYGVWAAGTTKPQTEGPVPAAGTFAIPVVCPAKGKAAYQIYFGNREAWGLADFWTKRPAEKVPAAERPVVAVGAVERLACREIGAAAAWPDAAWQYRVPVRVANFTDADEPDSLASFALPEVLRATRNAAFILTLDGKELRTCRLGDRLLFACPRPARSVTTCYAYVRAGAAATAHAVADDAAFALGSQIPSDQVLVQRMRAEDRASFASLLDGAGNLVRNGRFGDDGAGWARGAAKGVALACGTGGVFGAACAQTTVPAGVRPNWSGWRQTVAVEPGKDYFYGAFIRCTDLSASATVHAHLLTARGALGTGGMLSAGRGVSGTAPWTPVFGTFRAPADTAKASLQLTLNGTGTAAYDGVLLMAYAAARTGDPEFAPVAPAGAALGVMAVDPVVKVFRETPVEDRTGAAFEVALARNETEPLQLAVRSARGGAVELAVEGVPLKVEIGRVDDVPVDWPTAYYSCTTPEWELRFPRNGGQSDGWSGWWPDPIVPTACGTLVPNRTQAFWVNVSADAQTKAGTYRGRLVWKLDGAVVRTDPLAVKVWNFALPARPSFPAVYDLRLGSRYWKALGATADERREKLWAFMAAKKACPDSLGDVTFRKAADGTVTADFADYDRLAARYFDHYKFPFSYAPRAFYCFGWAMPPKPFLGEAPYEGTWPYEGADWTQLRPAYRHAYQQALKLYWDHMKEKGWADRITLYISDEPHFSRTNVVQQMIACCRMIHEVDPAIRIYSSTWRHCPEWNGALDAWGAGHYGCFPVEEMAARQAAGQQIWSTTDGQMCLDTPYCAVERLLPHYAHKYGARLFEFWGATWLTYDPWKFGWHAYIRQSDTPGKTYWVRYPAGDGYLIYPPKEGLPPEPVSTLRMEASRDGVEDFCYLELLAARAKDDPPAAALLAEYRALVSIPNAGGRYSSRILPVPERLGALRRRAGDLLSGTDRSHMGAIRER